MRTGTRWGIVGLGSMAETFARDLAELGEAASVSGVVSSSQDRAVAFADRFGGVVHASVDDLLADRQVDVVYVATGNDRHADAARRVIDAGCAVLVEKPFSTSAAETDALLARARERGVLAMEAMWTLCLPVYDQVRTWLGSGAIGEPRQLVARFGFRAVGAAAPPRLRDRAAGGGSFLDVGVYPVALAQLVFGPLPEVIVACGRSVGGVDEQAAAVLRFPGGGLALIASAIEVETDWTATIDGTAGRITIPDFWRARRVILETPEATESVERAPVGGGWASEALHVRDLLRAGRVESPLVTHASTVARAQVCDAILKQLDQSP